MIKRVFIAFSVLLLIYMLWPGPGKISDFSPLPFSDKSNLSGDTVQIPNVVGYFSDNYRADVMPFFVGDYQRRSYFPFPPLRLNHPPEYSWIVIKKHTDNTYLEELIYPLRDSLFIAGLESFYPDGNPKFWGSQKLDFMGHDWYTKATLRFYPSYAVVRILVWLGIILSIYCLVRLGKKILIQ